MPPPAASSCPAPPAPPPGTKKRRRRPAGVGRGLGAIPCSVGIQGGVGGWGDDARSQEETEATCGQKMRKCWGGHRRLPSQDPPPANPASQPTAPSPPPPQPTASTTAPTRPIQSEAMSQVEKVRWAAGTGARSSEYSSGEGSVGGRASMPSSSQPPRPLLARGLQDWRMRGWRRGAVQARRGLTAASSRGGAAAAAQAARSCLSALAIIEHHWNVDRRRPLRTGGKRGRAGKPLQAPCASVGCVRWSNGDQNS